MSLPHRDLWWLRKFETFERALCWPFPICRRGQTAAVVPGLSASKFPSMPTVGVGPQNPCIHQVLPSEPRSLLVAGMSSTALAAERLSGHSAAAPGSCCDTRSLIRDKDCCLILCARLVSSHFGVFLFLPSYFSQAE